MKGYRYSEILSPQERRALLASRADAREDGEVPRARKGAGKERNHAASGQRGWKNFRCRQWR